MKHEGSRWLKALLGMVAFPGRLLGGFSWFESGFAHQHRIVALFIALQDYVDEHGDRFPES